MQDILCVSNFRSGVGYAWWLMETFWSSISKQYPGRVSILFPKLDNVSRRIAESGAALIEAPRDSLADIVRDLGFRHIYLTDTPDRSREYPLLRAAGAKTIIVHRHHLAAPLTGWKRVAGYLPVRQADAYIGVSELVYEQFIESGIRRAKCHLARNGIPLDIEPRPAGIRQALGIPSDAPLVVAASRAHPGKRIDQLIKAASYVEGTYFIYCGGGPEFESLVAQVRNLGLENRFFLLGRREDVPNIIAEADIGVHPSAIEVGTSLSILEFMRAGLPVIVPDNPTVCQGIRHGSNGLLYESDSIESLAERISRLVKNPKFRLELGQTAKRDIQQYDIADTVDAVLRVFRILRI